MAPGRLFAALSFEDRARCGAQELAPTVDHVVMLDYGARATSGPDARVLREATWDSVVELYSKREEAVVRLPINPYSIRDLESAILGASEDEHVFIDLSCLTRPHVIAAARACVELSRQARSWSVVYSTPHSYGNLSAPSTHFGWRDTLILPIGRDPSASNEGVSLGLALLGQESERLQIALDEVEPAAGYVVHVERRERPDLYRRTLAENELVLKHLRSLRMPGRRADAIREIFPSLGWLEKAIPMEAVIQELFEVVSQMATAARRAKAPIFLFPFGPKLAGFAAAFFLATVYGEASWCVYPVAVTHPLDYSDGCARVDTFHSEEFVR